jgi:hypothetical protein
LERVRLACSSGKGGGYENMEQSELSGDEGDAKEVCVDAGPQAADVRAVVGYLSVDRSRR